MGNKVNKFIRRSRKKIAKDLTLRRIIKKSKKIQISRIYNVVAEHNYANNSYYIQQGDNEFSFSNENLGSEHLFEDDDSSLTMDYQQNASVSFDTAINSCDLRHLEGRRIFDTAYFFAQIKNLNNHGIGDCNFSHMKFLNETKLGLKSIFYFQCTKCGITKAIKSSEESNETLDINYALTQASYAIGIGCYQSEEFLANMEVPFMSSSTYDKNQKILQKDLKVCSKKEMDKAIDQEKLIAVQNNEVDVNNTPKVKGIVDGCWNKRSYGTSFSSQSGTATIIGSHTKKVVWNGVKNKYCKKCANDKIRNVKSDHVCNTNFHGAPTGMESKLLVEALKESEAMQGVRYSHLIADGDSKTFSAITDEMIYMDPPLKVTKRECCRHLYRCARGRLMKVKDLEPAKAKAIIHGIQCARKHWAGTDLPFHEKVQKFRENLQYIPHHVFGDHQLCDSYFCKKEKYQNDTNHVPEMQKSGQLKNIFNALARLIDNVKSLLYNEDTNLVEQFNSVVNKHTAAKRLNLTTAGSWEGRVDASVIDFNTHRLGSTVLKHKTNLPESSLTSKLIYKMETRRINQNLNRKTTPHYKKSVYSTDEYYGTDTCCQGELDDDAIEWRKFTYLRDLKLWQADRSEIERNTIGQSDCDYWAQINSYTINATLFGTIANVRSDKGYKEIVHAILNEKHIENLSQVRHDKNHWKDAIRELESLKRVKVDKCGMFIDPKFEYMTASPAGLIDADGIVVVSCPFIDENLTVEQAIQKRLITYWTVTRKPRSSKQTSSVETNFESKIIGFNTRNQFFHQIQGMLHITQRKYAVFVTWTPKNIKTEIIERDDAFWAAHIEPVIVEFFNTQFLPKVIRTNR